MTSENFCYFLQGLLEVGSPKTLNEEQVELIKRHLNMVFFHEIDPKMGDKEKQDTLTKIHGGTISRPRC